MRGAYRGRGGPGRGGRGGRGAFGGGRGGRKDRITAEAKTAFLRQDQTNSAQRLQRDLKELREGKTPLVGVSAEPLENDMFTWHGNLRGPKHTKWAEGVFHFEMTIPRDYPRSPPSIKLCAPLPHPNVFDTKLCLDMLENAQKYQIYEGWVPAYTIEGILVQLQAFLFEDMNHSVITNWATKLRQSANKLETQERMQALRAKLKLARAPAIYDSVESSIIASVCSASELRSFGLDGLKSDEIKAMIISDTCRKANEYVCEVCKHKGPADIRPPFAADEAEPKAFLMKSTPAELLAAELVCFHTKIPLREATLGVGISIKKSSRTGLVDRVNPTMDLMSMRAFTKLKVRKALGGERFTQWLPLYFGETEKYSVETESYDHKEEKMITESSQVDTKARFDRHLMRTISYLAAGNAAKGFKHSDVLEIGPRLIMSHVVSLMKEDRHISIVAIRRLFNFLRLFHYLAVKDEKIQQEIDTRLEKFLSDPDSRLKYSGKCPNLGDILVFATLSSKYRFADLLKPYLEERLDRSVFWMLREMPELDFENQKLKNRGKVDEKQRMKVCFTTAKTSFHLDLFFLHLNNTIEKRAGSSPKSLDALATALDKNQGCLDKELENAFQQQLQATTKVDDMMKYYEALGVPCESEKEVHERLVQAVKNSRQKGYHGGDCSDSKDARNWGTQQSHTRVVQLLEQFTDSKIEDVPVEKKKKKKEEEAEPKPNQIDSSSLAVQQVAQEDEGGPKQAAGPLELPPLIKKTVKAMVVKGALEGENSEAEWKKLCIKNFDFIQQAIEQNKYPNLTPDQVAYEADFQELNFTKLQTDKQYLVKHQDKLGIQLRKSLQQDKELDLEHRTVGPDYEGFTWRRLFIKLAFEYLLFDLQYNLNFEIIYEFIKVFGEEIESLLIRVIDKTHLKSNHYWVMGIIPKLKNLKTLKICNNNPRYQFNEDGWKFLSKAVGYFQENGGELRKFQCKSVLMGRSSEYLYACLKCLPNIQILNFRDNALTTNDAKAIGKVLSSYKHIKELDLSNTSITVTQGKEIADGLMRAKQLEILKLRDNRSLDCVQMIYNLAFSPKINHIDMTNVSTASDTRCVEALFKLLKISGSIQTLLLGGTNIAPNLSRDFCLALGENRSVERLNLDYAGGPASITNATAKLLGRACALNKFKNGSLTHLSMARCFNSHTLLEQFLGEFMVSEYDHETWYGDPKVAETMEHGQLDKHFQCGLHCLHVGGSTFTHAGFRFKEEEAKNDPKWPTLTSFLAHSKVAALHLDGCQIDHRAIELYSYALAPGNPIAQGGNLKVLNLSRNKLTKDGAKTLATALKVNTSIEFLDLSQNQLGVYGVVLLSAALRENQTLKGLNLFKNTLDVDGSRALRELLKVNSSIELLDIGHNRIRAKGLEAIREGILANEASKLHTLGLRMNFINDDGFQRFFDEVVVWGQSPIQNLYIQENNLSQHKADRLHQELKKLKLDVFVDAFEKMSYLKEERMRNTIWFGPLDQYYATAAYRSDIINRFTPDVTGLVKAPLRFRVAKKVRGKTTNKSVYMFVEFEGGDDNEESASIAKVTKAVFKGRLSLSRKCYRVGTNTFVVIRRSKRKGR